MSSTLLPVDEWIDWVEEARARSSAAGRVFFLLPAPRRPTPSEQLASQRAKRAEAVYRWRRRRVVA